MDIEERAKLLRELLVWSTILPIKTKLFVFVKRELDFDKYKLLMRLSKEIFSFLDKYRDYFMSFDKIIVYYDKGQQVVEKALLQSSELLAITLNSKMA